MDPYSKDLDPPGKIIRIRIPGMYRQGFKIGSKDAKELNYFILHIIFYFLRIRLVLVKIYYILALNAYQLNSQ